MATAQPTAIMATSGADVWLWAGTARRGRALEIIAIKIRRDDGEKYRLVLHVMPTRFRK